MENISNSLEERRPQNWPPSMSLFLNNAFLFYRNADLILANPSMANATVPILDYVVKGKKGGRMRLGSLVKWWKDNEVILTKDLDGNDALLFHFIGNPSAKTNRCSIVYPDGYVKTIVHPDFATDYSSFIKMHEGQEMAAEGEVPYSLEEVVNTLLSI